MQEQSPLTVIFFGLQGTGKGTQARLLQEYLDTNTKAETIYLETGQLLRDFMAESDGYTNTLTKEIVSSGGLLPSFMPTFILGRQMVSTFTGDQHLIFDGATRRLNQTVMLDSMLRFYKRTPYHVVLIELSEEVATERLLMRGRSDDTREKIQKRIAWSKEHMDEVLKQFENFECTIHRVDGEPAIENVNQQVLATLNLS